MIEIVVNGKKESIKACNIEELIELLGYHDNSFAVAINGTFVSLQKYHDTVVNSGDEIEILAPMVGG
ncbi:MAG TPA: sulfur carrier protein ThiS [Campylobacterales bacterium]|nr:sulfur carrier protein ThiS [Campylobacterales bacterium]